MVMPIDVHFARIIPHCLIQHKTGFLQKVVGPSIGCSGFTKYSPDPRKGKETI
jgi:hypothetical protein